MDIEAYLQPECARRLAPGSAERALASLALRNFWHQLFDRAPRTLALAPPDGKAIMEPFLHWAAQQRLSMGWGMHLQLLDWLWDTPSWRARLDETHVEELVTAAILRWAVGSIEEPAALGIVVSCHRLPSHAVGARRPQTPTGSIRVFRLEVPFQQRSSACRFAITKHPVHWDIGPWQPIPS